MEAEVNELKEKLHISEQNSKINTYEQIVEELEKNLTITENELLKFKEIEMELKKQIYNLKSENSSIKNENEKLLKYKVKKNIDFLIFYHFILGFKQRSRRIETFKTKFRGITGQYQGNCYRSYNGERKRTE